MTGFPNATAWRKACAADAVLGSWVGPWAVCFAVRSGSDTTIFNFLEGQVSADPGTPAFICEQVADAAVEPLCRECAWVGGMDQLGADADLVARALDAPSKRC